MMFGCSLFTPFPRIQFVVVEVRLVLVSAIAAVFLFVFGCAAQQPFACNKPYIQVGSACCLDQNNNGICDKDEQANVSGGNGAAAAGTAAGVTGANASAQAGLQFSEWKAPDGSITLQVPQGWNANEKQVDNCTVSWSVKSPDGTSDAFMNNEIMVLKSESARQMYKSYGLTGIDSVPVNGYLGAEQALSQVIAPLAGSSSVKVLSRDATLSSQFSQAVCIPGFAACDAQVFEAAFENKGTQMRGYYLVQRTTLARGRPGG